MALLRPVTLPYVDAGQGTAAAEFDGQNEPAGHGLALGEPDGQNVPPGHGEGVLVYPGQNCPGRQAAQLGATLATGKNPGAHETHADEPDGAKKPNRHGAGNKLLGGQAAPAGQSNGDPEPGPGTNVKHIRTLRYTNRCNQKQTQGPYPWGKTSPVGKARGPTPGDKTSRPDTLNSLCSGTKPCICPRHMQRARSSL